MSSSAGRYAVAADAHRPVRTCVGCRDTAPASTLLRVVAMDGVLIVDSRRRLPGRGAWLHPRLGCLDIAERRRAFGRALRIPTGALQSHQVRALLSQDPCGGRTPGSGTEVAAEVPPRTHRKQVDPS